MAGQLNRTAANAVLNGKVEEAVVGANRRLRREGDTITGTLHGWKLVVVNKTRLRLDAALKTPPCRIAMADFLNLLGHKADVSFAKGRFVVNLDGKVYATEGATIEVDL